MTTDQSRIETAARKVIARAFPEFPDTDSCWECPGERDRFGYVRVSMGRGQPYLLAHRVIWAYVWGGLAFPEAPLCVLHTCDNPPCARPSHLYAGTKAQNTADMVNRGRWVAPPILCGEAHPRARYRQEQVDKLRNLMALGTPIIEAARVLRIGRSQAWKIARGHAWVA